ncbi:MAG: SDR family NAD(P)-dependent oxidoreductase [Pseudomonadota bacterium]
MSQIGTALITGASAGIGKELANMFAKKGHDLILVARRKPELDALAAELSGQYDIGTRVEVADLAIEGAADELFERVSDAEVEILVNNAGVLTSGSFRRMKPAAIDNMIRVNVLGLTGLCHRFVQPMLDRGHGRILNVASIAGFQAVPTLAVYAATKAYVLSLGEALSVETDNSDVSVTTVCPGFTDTDMLHGATDKAKAAAPNIPDLAVLSPQRVAQDAYNACMSGDAIKVPGIGYSLTMAATRLVPRWVLRQTGAMALRFASTKRR